MSEPVSNNFLDSALGLPPLSPGSERYYHHTLGWEESPSPPLRNPFLRSNPFPRYGSPSRYSSPWPRYGSPPFTQVPRQSSQSPQPGLSSAYSPDLPSFPLNAHHHGPLTTNVTNTISNRYHPYNSAGCEQARALIGQSSLEAKKTKGRKPGRAVESEYHSKALFGGDDLIAIARVVVEKQPFFESYGHKRAAWEAINELLCQRGFRHCVPSTTIQQKAEALIAHKKDPLSQKPAVKAIARVLSGPGSCAITIAALVEQMEAQWDLAKDKSDEGKAALKKKQDDDREGGQAIRAASMAILRKRLHSPSPESDGVSELVLNPVPLSVPEASGSAPTPGSPILNSDTAEIDDNEPGSPAKHPEKPKKRSRVMDRRSTRGDRILALMKDDSVRREEHDKRIQSTLAELTEETKRAGLETTNILQQFLELERSRAQAL